MNTPHLHLRRRIAAAVCASFAALSCALAPFQPAHAQGIVQIDIPGPPGSGAFGTAVTVLPNGNFVVTDPLYDEGSAYDVGAVYLFDGATLELISTLKGSTTGDRVGSHVWPQRGVTVLANGNYVVRSPYWSEGRGAVTWGSATSGVSGTVSAANSLVGSKANDGVGYVDVKALPNGNYVVISSDWNESRGAVTWGDGTTGIGGEVSAANSLVGSTVGDAVGGALIFYVEESLTVLADGDYVVCSPQWDNGAATDAGAVTWGSATGGVRGEVSAANSLVGSTADDRVCSSRYFSEYFSEVTALPNGSYVVVSPDWDNGALVDAGAVTWGSGAGGVQGEVSAANSLVGGTVFGGYFAYVTVLANGNYAVSSSRWNGERGAVTWGSAESGVSGVISAANSLVGDTAGDAVGGFHSVIALANGNYVVSSPNWHGKRGAATWGSGATGVSGLISDANSLVGAAPGEWVGSHAIVALTNGNYVVGSPNWDGGRGAATWADGAAGIKGSVSAANSLVGSAAGDAVGVDAVALTNGNYVVTSSYGNDDRGAVTWADGATGARGALSAANSLVGSAAGDRVGTWVTPLANGNYVVGSPFWNGERGAATWADGTAGAVGPVSAANSLVGSAPHDAIGFPIALANGNYLVKAWWNEGLGSLTWGNGASGISGEVSAANSLVGSEAYDTVATEVTELANGNYVVTSPDWNDQRGAVTWGSGASGVSGEISAANSLVGSSRYDRVGWSEDGASGISQLIVLPDGNYVVGSPGWDREGIVDAGAVTWGDGATGVTDAISTVNSVLGATAGGGRKMSIALNESHRLLIVGRQADNTVTVVPLDFGRMLLTLIIRLEEQPGR